MQETFKIMRTMLVADFFMQSPNCDILFDHVQMHLTTEWELSSSKKNILLIIGVVVWLTPNKTTIRWSKNFSQLSWVLNKILGASWYRTCHVHCLSKFNIAHTQLLSHLLVFIHKWLWSHHSLSSWQNIIAKTFLIFIRGRCYQSQKERMCLLFSLTLQTWPWYQQQPWMSQMLSQLSTPDVTAYNPIDLNRINE